MNTENKGRIGLFCFFFYHFSFLRRAEAKHSLSKGDGNRCRNGQ